MEARSSSVAEGSRRYRGGTELGTVVSEGQSSEVARAIPARRGRARGWQDWAPYAAVAWSLVYAALGAYWAVGGSGFPYTSGSEPDVMGPVVGRFGPGAAWAVVMALGLPAALGTAMLRGMRVLRPLVIAAGTLLAALLLLFTTDIGLLILLGYTPYSLVSLLTGGEVGWYVEALTRWSTVHQLLCITGGFLWLAATVAHARRSGDACLSCGCRDGLEGWSGPHNAARWGRTAVYVAMVVPVLYALTRYAWALGVPLGMSEEHLRSGQESGTWISGLFLATFGLVGAALMLGLVQRWGEVFPRWMVGLAGRRVPIALAVVPASIASVLLMVGGISIWSGMAEMAENAAATGEDVGIAVGPAALFLVWGAALAVATLGYYYRRRGLCGTCGRGTRR
jgi:hypothetical protein